MVLNFRYYTDQMIIMKFGTTIHVNMSIGAKYTKFIYFHHKLFYYNIGREQNNLFGLSGNPQNVHHNGLYF